MKKQVDNFDLLKEEFEIRFKKKWDHSPSLYLQYYQARVMDAMLLALTQNFSESKMEETKDRSRLEKLRKILERNGFSGPKRYKKV
jgi:hypothetical protein